MCRLSCEINCEINSQVVHYFHYLNEARRKNPHILCPTPTPHGHILGCFLSSIMITCVQKQILHMKESHFHPTS